MRRRLPAVLGSILLLAACTTAPPMPDPPPDHPASPAAAEAPRPAPSSTLNMPERQAEPRPAGTAASRKGH